MNLLNTTTGVAIVQEVGVRSIAYRMPDGPKKAASNVPDWGWIDPDVEGRYPAPGSWGSVPSSCSLEKMYPVRGDYGQWNACQELYDAIGQELARMKILKSDPQEVVKNRFFRSDQMFTYKDDFESFIAASYALMDTLLRVDQKMYEHWMWVIPPMLMGRVIVWPDGNSRVSETEPNSMFVNYVHSEGNHLGGKTIGDDYFMVRLSGDVRVSDSGKTLDQIYYSS